MSEDTSYHRFHIHGVPLNAIEHLLCLSLEMKTATNFQMNNVYFELKV